LGMTALQISEGRGMDFTPTKQTTSSSSYKVVQSAVGSATKQQQHMKQSGTGMTSTPKTQTRSRHTLYPGGWCDCLCHSFGDIYCFYSFLLSSHPSGRRLCLERGRPSCRLLLSSPLSPPQHRHPEQRAHIARPDHHG
jgi:hypothetical protein